MIKPIPFVVLFLIMVLSLNGCRQTSTEIPPTNLSQPPSPTVIHFTYTHPPTNTPSIIATITPITQIPTKKPSSITTITPTPLDTLEPVKADELILALLQDPGDCIAPCFWGIAPGKTNYDEANRFFYHLGMSPFKSTVDGKNYVSYEYEVNNDLRIAIILGLQENIVENLKIGMVPEAIKGKAESDWMAYSISNIVKQYGKPTQVNFSWSLGEITTLLTTLYYDEDNLIVEFHNPNGPEPSSPVECPLEVIYDYVAIWMGKNPPYPPGRGASLDEATSLTMDEFVKMMTGNSEDSCFNLNINAFLPHQ